MTQRLAIIGGDAGGMSAASIARRRDPKLEIVAFERGELTSFSACGIPYLVGGVVEDAARLISRTPQRHRENGIDVRTGCEVLAIDLAARTLTVREARGGESTEPFDQLVVATGAEAAAPPIAGAGAIEPARTIDAGERLSRALDDGGRRAVVIGAGYIGLEMAEAFVSRGLQVTMIDRAPQVMLTLDADMAAHVQRAAEGHGIRVVLGATIEEIVLDGDGVPVEVRADGETYPVDHVVIGTGAKPAVAVAQGAGLESETAARCASTTTSAAPATTASLPRATARRATTACSIAR